MIKLLDNCRILDENFEIIDGRILILDDTIGSVLRLDEPINRNVDLKVNLEKRIVFPGLLNAHDHLVDSFWPPLSDGPYESWIHWEEKKTASKQFRMIQQLSLADLYTLGFFRNVMSGATTVMDHFPREFNKPFMNKLQVNLLEHYFLAHSAGQRHHNWGCGLEEEFRQSKGVLPFFIHVCEGFSPDIRDEVEILNRMGILSGNTVLVNGPALQDEDVEMIASKKSSFVWCPISTQTIFHQQPPIKTIIEHGIPVAIGTDSAISGSVNLLEDLRFARRFLQPYPDKELVKMATIRAAEVLMINKRCGSIAPGKSADFLIFEDFKNDPFESFFALTPKDIAVVVNQGNLIYGEEMFRSTCSLDFSFYSEIMVKGRPKIIHGKLLQLLDRIEHKLGILPDIPFIPVLHEPAE